MFDEKDMARERLEGWNGGFIFGLAIGIVGMLIGFFFFGPLVN